ncbi:MAG: response regulator transcription factor [Crocinitomicaceae bacterium]|nr:response regulator transcription factor [Crocinitomicaceae bacterium]
MNFCKIFKRIFLITALAAAGTLAHAETEDQHIKVALRTIGHEFLLELGDSTSRVMPIEKIDGRYALKFERTFSFVPAVLSYLTWKYLSDSRLNASYIVEAERCGTNQVVHSFEVNPAANDSSVACEGRALPEDCYVFYFTLIETLPAGQTVLEKGFSDTAAKKSSSSYLYLLVIPAIGVAAFILFKRKKNNKTKPGPESIKIGDFQFDQKSMLLRSKKQSIELSSKEADLLFLLFSNENKTLERAYILNLVWGDEGDYVGRTLDVFVSKLRKKLEADPSLKIINIRGVGYKFVIG